jgi:hypothetical protein
MNGNETAILDPVKARIHPGEISILCGTRGRPEMLAKSFESLRANTVQKDKTHLWIYVDDDDQIMRQAIEAKTIPDPGLPIHWHIAPRTAGLGQIHQALWNASGRASEVYMFASDKSDFATPGWDEVIRSKAAEHPDGVMLAFAHDPNTADQGTYPILGWNWVRTLGYFFPGYFPFWFDDLWMDQIGRMAGRFVKLPIVIAPVGGARGRTQRMRNVPFWTRFFQLMLPERKDAARKLIAAMNLPDEAARSAALKNMEEVAALLAKEQEIFSDVYATFQEERHTALSPEERNHFNPLYFKLETQAVTRLISFAEELVAQEQHSEALKYLDATLLSDVRVRWAEKLKVNSLRALGRQAEADQLAQQVLAAWPEMGAMRRCFRFLGMVASEGKRLFVIATNKKDSK